MYSARRTNIRHAIAGSASATGNHACGDAVEGAMADLGGEAGLVLIFTAGEIDLGAASAEGKAPRGGAPGSGMSRTGHDGARGLLESGWYGLAILSFLSDA